VPLPASTPVSRGTGASRTYGVRQNTANCQPRVDVSIQSHFATFQCELLALRRFTSHAEAGLALFRWIKSSIAATPRSANPRPSLSSVPAQPRDRPRCQPTAARIPSRSRSTETGQI
jgi:hypothetical protein